MPASLKYSIPAPHRGFQTGAGLGSSVAVEGAFTVAGAPGDDLVETDSGTVKVFDSASGRLLHLLPHPRPAAGERFGASVAISGSRVLVGAPKDLGQRFPGSAYLFDLASATPTLAVATLDDPVPEARGSFGYSVAISGNRAIVGVPYDGVEGQTTGSAYVYDFASATPTVPSVTLKNPSPSPQFGWSVAISGVRAVVGLPGRCAVYEVSSGTPPVPVAILTAPTPQAGAAFGWGVAISGTRVVVGAPASAPFGSGGGAAYVYDLSSASPGVPAATLNNPSNAPLKVSHSFGGAVAISGTQVIVGPIGADPCFNTWPGPGVLCDSRDAYLYDLDSTNPTVPLLTLDNPNPKRSDHFGNAVAISGTRAVVGNPADDIQATGAGSVYGYDFSRTPPEVPRLMQDDPGLSVNDHFGTTMAISGTRLVVGAPRADGGQLNAGSAYVYDLAAGKLTQPIAILDNPNPGSDRRYFGSSVAISNPRVVVAHINQVCVYDLTSAAPTKPLAKLANPGVLNDFGRSVAISGARVLVGAPGSDTGAESAGSAFIYDLGTATPTEPAITLNNPSPGQDDGFGGSVSISGSLAVIGVYGDDSGAQNAGSAYVYDLGSATPTVPVVTLNNPAPEMWSQFGNPVAISGTRVVLGATNTLNNPATADARAVYVYDLASAAPTLPIAVLSDPSPQPSELFGTSIAISGTQVLVGARLESTGAKEAGSVYLFDLSSATPMAPVATLHNPSPAVLDHFGTGVAIDGTTVAIGAPAAGPPYGDPGKVYIYGPPSSPADTDGDGLRDAWELTYWPSLANHGPGDDFDHDGYQELLELAFGLNPTRSDPGGLPLAVDESGYLTMTIAKHAGVAYEVQSAGTLVPGQPNSFSVATTLVLINDAATLKVRDKVPSGTSPARFMRARVTAAP